MWQTAKEHVKMLSTHSYSNDIMHSEHAIIIKTKITFNVLQVNIDNTHQQLINNKSEACVITSMYFLQKLKYTTDSTHKHIHKNVHCLTYPHNTNTTVETYARWLN